MSLKRNLKRVGLGLGALIALLVVVVLVRTLTFSSTQIEPPPAELVEVPDAAVERLAQAVRFKTVSTHDPAQMDPEPFAALVSFIEESYPEIHAATEHERVSEYSLLYRWEGEDASKPPVLLMGHTDVVPVEEATRERWSEEPFGGAIKGGYVWGRGTLDDKVSVFGILEAAELLASQGFKPSRTVYFAFGHDEEVGGNLGAQKISALLAERGVEFEWTLDEGLAIVQGVVPGTQAPVALIGLAEKGFATMHLTVEDEGGHSSMPPRHTAVGKLAQAVIRLEDNQVPAELSGPLLGMFESVGPEMNFGFRMIFANLWLFSPVVIKILEGKRSTNATLRTTTAVTMFEGSPQDNVLPKRAKAAVNFRIHPRDSIESIEAHVKRYAGPEVEVEREGAGFNSEPSPVSSQDSEGYEAIGTSIRQVWSDAIVAPSLTVGATDGRFYQKVSKDVYRFAPVYLVGDDTARIHGVDERISVDNYKGVVRFYAQLMRNL